MGGLSCKQNLFGEGKGLPNFNITPIKSRSEVYKDVGGRDEDLEGTGGVLNWGFVLKIVIAMN